MDRALSRQFHGSDSTFPPHAARPSGSAPGEKCNKLINSACMAVRIAVELWQRCSPYPVTSMRAEAEKVDWAVGGRLDPLSGVDSGHNGNCRCNRA